MHFYKTSKILETYIRRNYKKKKFQTRLELFRNFEKCLSIKKFSGISTCLIENKIQYNWINDCQKAFQESFRRKKIYFEYRCIKFCIMERFYLKSKDKK